MANNVLEYLSRVAILIEGFDSIIDQAVFDADNGENSTMDEGKGAAIDRVDNMLETLKEFRMDIKRLSLRALKEKY